MSQRITMMIDDDLVTKLRLIQSKLIATSPSSVSFSSVVNQTIRKGLKKWLVKQNTKNVNSQLKTVMLFSFVVGQILIMKKKGYGIEKVARIGNV